MSGCPIHPKETLLKDLDAMLATPPKTPLEAVFYFASTSLIMIDLTSRFSADDDIVDPLLRLVDVTADLPATKGNGYVVSAITSLAILCRLKKFQPQDAFDQKSSLTLSGLFGRCARHDRAAALEKAKKFTSEDRPLAPPGSQLRAAAEQAVRDFSPPSL